MNYLLNMIRYVIRNDYRGDILMYLRVLWISYIIIYVKFVSKFT